MNITTPEQLCSELWQRLLLCSLVVLAMAAVATVRLTYLPVGPDASAEQMIEMACWRISLLLAFHSAPLVWARFIFKGYRHKQISIPLYQTMAQLRMPVATWAGGCLVTAVILWPQLNT
jgi:hypothetical protein